MTYTFEIPCENVIYTAKWIKVTLEKNKTGAGTITTLDGTYKSGESVTITATTNRGYTFVGWYNGETELTKELTHTFGMPSENVTYTAKWIKVALAKNKSEAGTVTALNGKYSVGESVTVTATTNSGYTFVGWYNGETELTKELSYTFAMPNEDITYTAKWSKVTLVKNKSEAGTVTVLNGKYSAGESVTVTATTNNGYTFVGWFNGETELTKELSYTFEMPSEDITYTAKWVKVTLEINNIEAGSVSDLDGTYKTGESVTITATTNRGYTFVGWYNGETELTKELSYTFVMPSEDATFTAKWLVCEELKNFIFTYNGDGFTVIGVNDKTVDSLVVPNCVTQIADEAFLGCDALTDITIPNSVKSVGKNAFSGCGSLKYNSYDNGEYLGNEDNPYFLLIKPSSTSISSFTINGKTNIIACGALSNCSSISSITLPFVGGNKNGAVNTHFGYLFGASSDTENSEYVPSSLKTVVITGSDCIYGSAFSGCSGIINITIPDSVTSIGSDAFKGCSFETATMPASAISAISKSSLKEIVITSGDTIADYAFSRCTTLKSVTMNTVKSIGRQAFSYCGLTTVSMNMVERIGRSAFSNCNFTSITLPEGLTSISDSAFGSCKRLKSVSLPDSVTDIGANAFDSDTVTCNISGGAKYLGNSNNPYVALIEVTNSAVTSFTVNTKTKVIAGYAFYSLDKLTSVTIPFGVAGISASAFYLCNNLREINVPVSVQHIGKGAFIIGKDCLTSMSIPFVGESRNETENTHFGYIFGAESASVNATHVPTALSTLQILGGNIAEDAFYGCGNITSISVAYGDVARIGKGAFAGCTGLTSISIPFVGESANGTENSHFGYIFGASSFNENSAYVPETLESVTVTDSNLISKNAFTGCGNLTNITIHNSVKGIGEAAFYECTALTKVDFIGTIAEWCTMRFGSASSNPLYYAKNLYINNTLVTDITVPNTVTQILPYVFFNCTSITNVTIADSVTVIGLSAFNGCSEITEITLGNGLTSIRNATFWACSSLQRVNYTGTIADWCNIEFVSASSNPMYYAKGLYIDGVDVTSNLVIPEGVSEIKNFAFSNCTAMTTVTISSTVTSIGEKAFMNCNKLSSIVFDGTMEQWNTIAKGVDWNSNTGNYTIQCIDGDISKS